MCVSNDIKFFKYKEILLTMMIMMYEMEIFANYEIIKSSITLYRLSGIMSIPDIF